MARDLAKEAGQAIPVTILTGFLGSGKTTLLNHLLSHPEMGDVAVLINEYGDVALDHLLVREISEDVVVLNSGCVCCTVRGDLVDALKDLFIKRVKGEITVFNRVVIETTGLADPAPLIHTLMTDPLLGTRYRLDGIITTVDAVHALKQFKSQPESVKQAAVADRLIVTKLDMIGDEDKEKALSRLRSLNPAAPILETLNGRVEPRELFEAGLFKPGQKHPDVAGWLRDASYNSREKEKEGNRSHEHEHEHEHGRGHDHGHDDGISSFCLIYDAPLSWTALASALDLLLATKGENLLRVKGILNLAGEDTPVAIHGVQHVFHPPVPLPSWPDDERRSKIVFITRNLGQRAVEKILNAVMGGES